MARPPQQRQQPPQQQSGGQPIPVAGDEGPAVRHPVMGRH